MAVGIWWTYLIAGWIGGVIGWILCSTMVAAHRSDQATGDEPAPERRATAAQAAESGQKSTSRVA